ncbi:MAG TPA: RimK family protein [Spirochaetota bacterium]|nr:RimK family protein [Spirochaetota bacterium]
MPAIIVTNNTKTNPFSVAGVETVSAKDYLVSPKYSNSRDLKVFNLCRSYGYQTDGYYVSLLAAARGHKAYPAVRTIQETKSLSVVKIITEDLEELIQKSLRSIQSGKFSFNIYFGNTWTQRYSELGQKVFRQFPAPLLRVDFIWQKREWRIQNIQLIALNDIPEEHMSFVQECAKKYFAGKMQHLKRRVSYRYDLAILVNENEKKPPSNKKAIDKFEWAAEKAGFNVEIIDKEDYDRLSEFDALFIRETTNVNHHTFRFSQRAEADGLVVIDDPSSILKCTNKVYLAEVLNHYRIPAPKTMIINHENKDSAIKYLGYPTILKEPDSSFSQGVVKVVNREDFKRKVDDLLDKSDLIIAQEFVPTKYDWRVGIMNNEVLYVCKYYMAKEHWQIVDWHGGRAREGKWDSVKLADTPPVVIRTALRAAKPIGDGLYGVDLKMVGKKCYVIEVNDNPSIETGVEDAILKDELYLKIMRNMFDRVQKKKNGKDHS